MKHTQHFAARTRRRRRRTRHIAKRREVSARAFEVSEKSVVEDVYLIEVEGAQQIVRLATDVSHYQHRLKSDFALNAEVPLLRHLWLK